MSMSTPQKPIIHVHKRDHTGRTRVRYEGVLVERGATWVCLDAIFQLADVVRPYVVFRQGDRLREWHYSDRWYNVFALYDVIDDRFKGWYCNLTRPAVLSADTVLADDLALDVFVSPSGAVLVLDEDEFAALDLTPAERSAALSGLADLLERIALGHSPFEQP